MRGGPARDARADREAHAGGVLRIAHPGAQFQVLAFVVNKQDGDAVAAQRHLQAFDGGLQRLFQCGARGGGGGDVMEQAMLREMFLGFGE